MLGGGNSPSGSLEGGDSHFHVAQARADSVRVQRELAETRSHLATLQAWAQWAERAAGSLRARLHGHDGGSCQEAPQNDGAGYRGGTLSPPLASSDAAQEPHSFTSGTPSLPRSINS